ncbi:MAG TPA: ATP synthase subunit C [Spirochaetales bacterium]|nr:ATP synthase subunit C [Spirochaetales bacterium]HPS14686.1 ATP synthase subunit C [Spirochaetales bacterium]
MKKKLMTGFMMFLSSAAVFAQDTATAAAAAPSSSQTVKYLAAALAVGLTALAGGYAVAKIGSSAMGAMAEKPDLSGRALPYVGLAEGICLWGFLVAVLILYL